MTPKRREQLRESSRKHRLAHREQLRESSRKYKLTHRNEINACTRKRLARYRKWLQSIKVASGCKFCGEKHPSCLDFHHKDPKEKSNRLSQLVGITGKEGMMIEIKKCDVVCTNCHRKLHWNEKIESNNLIVK